MKVINKAQFEIKKQKAIAALELANYAANAVKKSKKTGYNYNSPNVREKLGFCKPVI